LTPFLLSVWGPPQSSWFLYCGPKVTEKMEDILTGLYPEYRILRLDRDSARKKESAKRIIKLFRDGEANILLGTQMVAKGHDFPRVNVVGVIDADTGLGLPDFRAQERTFQLITQVAGRAGRHSERGAVFIQTFRPDNPALNFALKHNYTDFFNSELQIRTELHYPPATKMVKIAFIGKKEKQVQDQIQLFSRILQKIAGPRKIRLLGPGQAVHKKIGGQFRSQVFGKCFNPMALHRAVKESLEQFNPHHIKSVRIQIDPDPVSLL
jgi:primosomal protein N' (replication factor Y)